jgi:hypothetical protein
LVSGATYADSVAMSSSASPGVPALLPHLSAVVRCQGDCGAGRPLSNPSV